MKKKTLSTLFKILISILFIYVVYSQIPFKEVVKYYKNLNILYLILAILAFIASQWISSKRLLLYIHQLGYPLSEKQNAKLYTIGMFYNFFIPGGIGGDAYKVYFLSKKYKWKVKSLTQAIFLDRLIGLAVIVMIICILLAILNSIPTYIRLLMPFLVIIGLVATYLIIKWWGKAFTPIWWKAISFSFIVQVLQMLCIVFIILSLHYHEHIIEYLLMFLVSSIVGLISFGGIGVREYVFLQASKYLHINEEISVAIGLLFTLITALVSFIGIYYIWFEKKHFPAIENDEIKD